MSDLHAATIIADADLLDTVEFPVRKTATTGLLRATFAKLKTYLLTTTKFVQFSDVDVSTLPTDGQALVYNAAATKWKPGTVASGGGGGGGSGALTLPQLSAHRYWKVQFNYHVDFATSVAELQMRSTPGGANICTGGTPIFSSQDSAQPATMAFDGNVSNFWSVTSGGSGVTYDPQWIGYDFGAGNAKIVQEVVLIARNSGPAQDQTPKQGRLMYSDDGVNYFSAFEWDDGTTYGLGESRVKTSPWATAAVGAGTLTKNVVIGVPEMGLATASGSASAGYWFGHSMIVPFDCTVSQVRFWAMAAAATTTIEPAIYSVNNAGQAAVLLAGGPIVTGVVQGENQIPLATPLAVAAGTKLFIGIIGRVNAITIAAGDSTNGAYFPVAGASAPTNPTGFTVGGTFDTAWLYGTMTLAGGPSKAGTVFPTGPADGDVFYRTDRNIEYYWNAATAHWLSTQRYMYKLDSDRTSYPQAASFVAGSTMNPHFGDYDIYCESFIAAGQFGTGAANYSAILHFNADYTAVLNYTGTDSAVTTSTPMNVVVPATFKGGYWEATKTSGGNIYLAGWIRYRLIG